jgi:hypothetical protein
VKPSPVLSFPSLSSSIPSTVAFSSITHTRMRAAHLRDGPAPSSFAPCPSAPASDLLCSLAGRRDGGHASFLCSPPVCGTARWRVCLLHLLSGQRFSPAVDC